MNGAAGHEGNHGGFPKPAKPVSQKFLYFPFSKYCPEWISQKKYYNNLRDYDDLIGLNNLIEKLEILIKNKKS